MSWTEQVACIGKDGKMYNVSVDKPEGKRQLGRSMLREVVIKLIIGRLAGRVWS
jgi:hypothetical protein